MYVYYWNQAIMKKNYEVVFQYYLTSIWVIKFERTYCIFTDDLLLYAVRFNIRNRYLNTWIIINLSKNAIFLINMHKSHDNSVTSKTKDYFTYLKEKLFASYKDKNIQSNSNTEFFRVLINIRYAYNICAPQFHYRNTIFLIITSQLNFNFIT